MRKALLAPMTVGVLLLLVTGHKDSSGYSLLDVSGPRWPTASLFFYRGLEGSPIWDPAFDEAMDAWNSRTPFRFTAAPTIAGSSLPNWCENSETRSATTWAADVCGRAWNTFLGPVGAYVLAVTLDAWIGNTMVHAPILFNSTAPGGFNVYHGALQTSAASSTSYLADFRRVAVHEMGHALALGHETDLSIPAIMHPLMDTIEVPQADDIAGVNALYGSAPPPTLDAPALLSPTNFATISGTSVTLNWSQVGTASSYDVSFGTTATPPLYQNTVNATLTISSLTPGTTYYWAVASRLGSASSASSVFRFTVNSIRCAYQLSNTTANSRASGQSGSVGVTATSGCAWGAVSSVNWITLLVTSGSGNGTISYNIQANTGQMRTGTITLRDSGGTAAGTVFITQDPPSAGKQTRGDFDGDGKMDVAVYRPSNGTWWIGRSSTNFTAYASYQWGLPGDIPLPGDFDGDSKMDLVIYRPSGGTWWILRSSTNLTTAASYQWGLNGDVPVPGDFDGDGRTDLAVYRPSAGTWFIERSSTNFTTNVSYPWGLPGDIPAPGDFDGDGKMDLAVYRPSNGTWFIGRSSTNFTTNASYQWGLGGDIPVPGDFDGDGKMDLAVYRPSNGTWWILRSSTTFTTAASYQWGLNGDIPPLRRP